MAGTDRQLVAYAKYDITESDHDDEFNNIYTGGGLIDIRNLIKVTSENSWIAYRGIAKVHEALLMGTSASVWGDIPYSEAVNDDIATPKLDSQKAYTMRFKSCLITRSLTCKAAKATCHRMTIFSALTSASGLRRRTH